MRQSGESKLRTCGADGKPLQLPLIGRESHLLLSLFLFTATAWHCAYSSTNLPVEAHWSAVCRIADHVHLHVCGHIFYAGIKLPLERTGHWSFKISKYLTQLVSRCGSRHLTVRPNPSRNVSLSSLHRSNKCPLHQPLLPRRRALLNAMDVVTRYSDGLVCPDLTPAAAIHALERSGSAGWSEKYKYSNEQYAVD